MNPMRRATSLVVNNIERERDEQIQAPLQGELH